MLALRPIRAVRTGCLLAIAAYVAVATVYWLALRNEGCILWEAEIYKRERLPDHGLRRYYDWSGFGHAPCAVSTPLGPVQLRGLCLLRHVEAQDLGGPEHRRNARRWIAEGDFAPKPRLRDALGWADDVLHGEWEATVRAYRGDCESLEPDHLLTEKVLRAGDIVTAVGRYDAERAALVPAGGLPTEIIPGEAGEAARALRRHTLGTLVFAALLFVVAHGLAAVAALR